MKNILIPTIYESDTDHALKIAAGLHQNAVKQIVLLSMSEISDSIGELLFLSSKRDVDLNRRDQLIDFWSQYRSYDNITTEVRTHHQYGFSRPVARQLLSRFDVGMIVVPQSFRQSKVHIHQFALRLFHQSGCPMMMLTDKDISDKGIQRALYLDDLNQTHSGEVQQYAFHVIHKSMIKEDESVKSIVDRMHIDLIVKEKRKNEEKRAVDFDADDFGLPVLAI